MEQAFTWEAPCALGAGGRTFESCRPDSLEVIQRQVFALGNR
jgi:hypothetical protein